MLSFFLLEKEQTAPFLLDSELYYLNFTCVGILSACTSVHHGSVWDLPRPQEGMGSLELELQVVMRQHVGSGNRTSVLWKISWCF